MARTKQNPGKYKPGKVAQREIRRYLKKTKPLPDPSRENWQVFLQELVRDRFDDHLLEEAFPVQVNEETIREKIKQCSPG